MSKEEYRHRRYDYEHSPRGLAARKRARDKMLTTRRELIRRLKNRPCADCNGWFDPWQLDFDHLPGTVKIKSVGMFAHTASIARVITEAQKCEVVCANCHRTRTYNRKHEINLPQRNRRFRMFEYVGNPH